MDDVILKGKSKFSWRKEKNVKSGWEKEKKNLFPASNTCLPVGCLSVVCVYMVWPQKTPLCTSLTHRGKLGPRGYSSLLLRLRMHTIHVSDLKWNLPGTHFLSPFNHMEKRKEKELQGEDRRQKDIPSFILTLFPSSSSLFHSFNCFSIHPFDSNTCRSLAILALNVCLTLLLFPVHRMGFFVFDFCISSFSLSFPIGSLFIPPLFSSDGEKREKVLHLPLHLKDSMGLLLPSFRPLRVCISVVTENLLARNSCWQNVRRGIDSKRIPWCMLLRLCSDNLICIRLIEREKSRKEEAEILKK